MHKECCRTIEYQPSSLSYWNGWAMLALHSLIPELGWQAQCAYPILNLEILSKLRDGKK